jgi:hypothetical protein
MRRTTLPGGVLRRLGRMEGRDYLVRRIYAIIRGVGCRCCRCHGDGSRDGWWMMVVSDCLVVVAWCSLVDEWGESDGQGQSPIYSFGQHRKQTSRVRAYQFDCTQEMTRNCLYWLINYPLPHCFMTCHPHTLWLINCLPPP